MARLDKYLAQWERNANADPMWAILSDRQRAGAWDIDEFFATGQREVDTVFAIIARSVGAVGNETFLDFGCGMGRISRALGKRFQRGFAIDISPRMIELACEYNRAMEGRVAFLVNQKEDLSQIATNSISFVYSHIVLQHIPAAAQLAFISEFLRVLEPDGIAAFQTPTGRVPRIGELIREAVPSFIKQPIKRLLARPQTDVTMEMNTVSESSVAGIVDRAGCELAYSRFTNSTDAHHNGDLRFFDRVEAIERIRNGTADSSYLSRFFVVRKRR